MATAERTVGTAASVKLALCGNTSRGTGKDLGLLLVSGIEAAKVNCTWGTEETPDKHRRAHLRPDGHFHLFVFMSDLL